MLRALASLRVTFALLGVWVILVAVSPLFQPSNAIPFTPPSRLPIVTAATATSSDSSSPVPDSAAPKPAPGITSSPKTTQQTQTTLGSIQTTQTTSTTQSVSKRSGSSKDQNIQPFCTKTKLQELIHIDSCLTI